MRGCSVYVLRITYSVFPNLAYRTDPQIGVQGIEQGKRAPLVVRKQFSVIPSSFLGEHHEEVLGGDSSYPPKQVRNLVGEGGLKRDK